MHTLTDTGTILYLIGRECLYSVRLQQNWLQLPANGSRISSRTVLFTDVPIDDVSNEQRLHELFPSARAFWVAKDTEELDELIEDREKAVKKLESGLVGMSKAANKQQRKLSKNDEKESNEKILHNVYEKECPTHRLKPIIGKKVQTVPWAREQLQDLNPRIDDMQKRLIEGKDHNLPAVFVEFDTVEIAEAAFHKARLGGWTQYTPRAIGNKPQEIVWQNLKMSKTQRAIRYTAVIIAIGAMIVFWGPITAFIGSLTNINYLTNKVPFLGFINDIPSPILGVVTGLLPVLLLAIMMILVPVIMRGESSRLSHDLSNITSPLQICWCSDQQRNRAPNPDMVFCLPGHTSVPHHDAIFRCSRCGDPNHRATIFRN